MENLQSTIHLFWIHGNGVDWNGTVVVMIFSASSQIEVAEDVVVSLAFTQRDENLYSNLDG